MARTREFDEAAVLKAALLAFRENGFQRTSIADVAKSTGVQRGSLYNAYGSKETLFLAVYEHYSNRFLMEIQKIFSKGTLKQRLMGYFNVAIKNMRIGSPAPGCLTTRVIMEAADENKAIKGAIQNFLAQLEILVEKVLIEAIDNGEFFGKPRPAAKMFVAVTRGVAVLDRIVDDEKELWQVAEETIRLLKG
jgi:TetR/AcrR family transcriptional regulator, transcriptional repressor for nem operon